MYGRPHAPHWQKSFGTEIFFNPNAFTRVALHTRKYGPAYLRYLPVEKTKSLLNNFVTENFWHLANDTFSNLSHESFDKLVSDSTKKEFSNALASSSIFNPATSLTLFPLSTISVQDNYVSSLFFLVSANSFTQELLAPDIKIEWLSPTEFPPIRDHKGKIENPVSWLGVNSPLPEAATKIRTAILGALALTPLPDYRHMFSGRHNFGGICTLRSGDGFITSQSEPHTPALMNNITITKQDHAWLEILSSKLNSNEKQDRKEIGALEYFYRAWFLGPSERFPVLCMTLDAVFGNSSQSTKSVIDAITNVAGNQIVPARLSLLMDLRASVIHGGAPDVYDSRKYARYYNLYDHDPIDDLELLVGECLRRTIFKGGLVEHDDPNADIIAQARAAGRIPRNLIYNTILGPRAR